MDLKNDPLAISQSPPPAHDYNFNLSSKQCCFTTQKFFKKKIFCRKTLFFTTKKICKKKIFFVKKPYFLRPEIFSKKNIFLSKNPIFHDVKSRWPPRGGGAPWKNTMSCTRVKLQRFLVQIIALDCLFFFRKYRGFQFIRQIGSTDVTSSCEKI